MKILHLTLKKKWFDMIASGEKKEEYREYKHYWSRRLWTRDEFIGLDGGYFNKYDIVRFRNGYAKDAPTIDVEWKGIKVTKGREEWGAVPNEVYFVIKLGKVLLNSEQELNRSVARKAK